MKKLGNNEKIYNVAIYIRLSREDGDSDESNSVRNQKTILQNYVNTQENFILYDTYVDDGFSGTNFNRPAFEKMIRDIDKKYVNCVVVKDLSRFARNYIKAGEYMDIIFPEKKVRFISLGENYDSQYSEDSGNDMMLPIRNLFNEFHARDTSKKVQRVMHEMQKEGKVVAAFVPYGYQKSTIDKHKLVPDEYAAKVVKKIFDLYLSGMGLLTIAKALNEEGILCPTAYRMHTGSNYVNGKRLNSTVYWMETSIKTILENEVYIGTLVQGKTRRGINKKPIKLPKEEWIRVPDTHEAIIEKSDFEKVQHMLARNAKHMDTDKITTPFAGFLRCPDCGRAMAKFIWKDVITFRCGTYKRMGTRGCTAHTIKMDVLEKIVRDDLNQIIQQIDDLDRVAKENRKSKKKNFTLDKERVCVDIKKWENKKAVSYDDFREGLITKEELINYRNKCDEQLQRLEKHLISIEKMEREVEILPQSEWIDKLLETKHIDEIDRDIVTEMIDVIYVYEDKSVEIVYRFSDELDYLFNKTVEC